MSSNVINGIVENQIVTINLASLAYNSVATSAAVDNSVNLFASADFQITVKTGVGTLPTGSVCVMFLKSADGGITFDDADESNAEVLVTFNANTDSTTYIVSADTAKNGGMLSEFFKIAILNETGASFDTTAANFSVKFLGKFMTSI